MSESTVEHALRIVLDDPQYGAVADPFAAPGQHRPEPGMVATSMLAECRKAQNAAWTASVETAGMPGNPVVTALRGEVQFVVHPTNLTEWRLWTRTLGVDDARGDSAGSVMVVRLTYGGAPARLIGVGVPALYGAALRAGRGTAVQP